MSTPKTKKPLAKRTPPQLPQEIPQHDRTLEFLEFCERHRLNVLIQNSYVISRLWAWFSKIQWSPRVVVPLPRFLTYRD